MISPAGRHPGAKISLLNFFSGSVNYVTHPTDGGCSDVTGFGPKAGLMRIVQISDTHLSQDKPDLSDN
jgi:hypothetical protein